MKAQISFVEYIVSFSIFSVFVAYLFFRLLSYMPAYLNELRGEKLRSEAYQLSEFLVNDPGEPVDWQTKPDSLVKRVGLSNIENKTNYLSADKVKRLAENCTSNYDLVKRWIGADYQFLLAVSDDSGSISAVCIPTGAIIRGVNATIKRFVAFDTNSYGELTVYVW